MTCDSNGPFEFLTRPYPYKREPFQLASGELVTYEGIYYSIPASSLMLDKRLFTNAEDHPVDSTIKLYINRDTGFSSGIEPDDDGEIYQIATPHYADYILDLRALIAEVTALHAADSDHPAQQFFEDHLRRVRATYDLSAHDISDNAYVHPEPQNTVPSGTTPPGASGSVPPPGDGFELGAQQVMDIDIDEVQWQVFTRPKNRLDATPGVIPTEPIFPAVLPGGSLPSFTSLDETNLTELALGGATSGGVVVTGDGLATGTSIKLSTASGVSPDGSGVFSEVVPWKLFPCDRELCSYYSPHEDPSGVISALGRQAVYLAPEGLSNGVYMLAVSASTEASGLVVQHYPSNYQATSGIDANGHAHDGVHVIDKLLYNLNSPGGGGTAIGYSPINGKKVFAHWVGSEPASEGETFGSAGPKYQNGSNVFVAGNVTEAADPTFAFSTQNWATTNNLFSPVDWAGLSTSALTPSRGLFGSPASTVYAVADIQAGSTRGVVTRKVYNQWGFIDQLVAPDLDRAQGGQRKDEVINYHTIEYNEGTDPVTGDFAWIKVGESDSSTALVFYENTFVVNNIFSLFFLRRPSNGMVHANGDIYVQWSDKAGIADILPRKNFFAQIGQPSTKLSPVTNRTDVTVSIGFFPAWKLVRYVTTNNQVTVPDSINISPAGSEMITFDPDLGFDDTFVTEFGPPVWDPDEGVNYIYFLWDDGNASRSFFAHMDTDFVIFRINQTDNEGILSGRMALLSI